MRVKTKANVTVTVDSAGKDKLFALDDTLAEVNLDGFKETSHGQVVLAASGTFTVPMGGISDCRGIFLKGTKDFGVSLNGLADLSVRRGIVGPTSGTKAASAKVLLEALLTSVAVTNGADECTLIYVAWGDPVA